MKIQFKAFYERPVLFSKQGINRKCLLSLLIKYSRLQIFALLVYFNCGSFCRTAGWAQNSQACIKVKTPLKGYPVPAYNLLLQLTSPVSFGRQGSLHIPFKFLKRVQAGKWKCQRGTRLRRTLQTDSFFANIYFSHLEASRCVWFKVLKEQSV